ELVAKRRQRRIVLDAPRERRRDRDDHALRANAAPIRPDRHVVFALDDLRDRFSELDAVTEIVGDVQRNALRAADETAFLRAAGGIEVALEGAGVLLVARCREVEQRVEQ